MQRGRESKKIMTDRKKKKGKIHLITNTNSVPSIRRIGIFSHTKIYETMKEDERKSTLE